MEMRQIEIDLEIHKMIETNRRSFSELPNTVLRRLLHLKNPEAPISGNVPRPLVTRGDWSKSGITLPERTLWRFTYNNKTFSGDVRAGAFIYEAQKFYSPSRLASSLGRTKAGNQTSLDGWRLVEIQRPGDEIWRTLNQLHSLLRGVGA